MFFLKLFLPFFYMTYVGFCSTEKDTHIPYQQSLEVVETLKNYDSIIVTGGAGFIGSHFIKLWLQNEYGRLVNLDALTYEASLENLKEVENNPNYTFVEGDIRDKNLLSLIFEQCKPKAVIHFAAESHVDRSIEDPELFLDVNVQGTLALLEASRKYKDANPHIPFRFIHISTDEVYGSLNPNDPSFTETTFYRPTPPYSASKAASDHFVHAYFHTYKLPIIITHCSNNYGSQQFLLKLVPKIIGHALRGEIIPVYGDGQNIRDWLHVNDHCLAIQLALASGKLGESYNIGGNNERKNWDVIEIICSIMDEAAPPTDIQHPLFARKIKSYKDLMALTVDRLYDDKRYSMDATKIQTELGWRPLYTLESSLYESVLWYLKKEGKTS